MATACLNLCFYSHFPHRQLGFSRSHQHSKNSKSEVIPLGSLHRSLCTNDFFAQERAVNLFSVLSVLMRHDDYPSTPLCLFSLGWLDYAGAVSLPRLARQKPVERWGHWTCSLRLLFLGDQLGIGGFLGTMLGVGILLGVFGISLPSLLINFMFTQHSGAFQLVSGLLRSRFFFL